MRAVAVMQRGGAGAPCCIMHTDETEQGWGPKGPRRQAERALSSDGRARVRVGWEDGGGLCPAQYRGSLVDERLGQGFLY